MAALVRERLYGLSVPRLLGESPSEEVHVWFARRGAGGGNESIKTPDRDAALACHRAGGSLYFRAPAEISDLLVTAASQQTGLSFGALYADGAPRSEVETFITRAGHVTEWHFDFMENFTLQLSGVKRWRLKRSAVEVPMRGCTPQWGSGSHAVRTAAEQQAKLHAQHTSGPFEPAPAASFWEDAEEVTLRPGSMLYVPAGMWHRVQCIDDSVSINVSLMGSSWADVVSDALRQRLLAASAARAPVCLDSISDGRDQLARILEVAQRELATLTPSILLPAALALPRARRLALPPPVPEGARAIRKGTCFARSPLAVLLRLPEGSADDDVDSSSDDDDEKEEEAAGDDGVGSAAGGDEGDADGEVDGDKAGRLPTRCGAAERLTATSDLFPETAALRGEADALFALHSHFGSEELTSLLRVELCTPSALVALMEWLRHAPAEFTARQAWRGGQQARGVQALRFETAAAVLHTLEHHGFCLRESSKVSL